MTPEEVALLQQAGHGLFRNFLNLVVIIFFYGVYCLIASLAMYNLLAKRNKIAPTWVLGALLAVIFLITTSMVLLSCAASFTSLTARLIENEQLELLQRFQIAGARITSLNQANTWLGGPNGLLFIFGDGIVVWRAWAIWPDQRIVTALPILTLLVTFALSLASSIIQTLSSANLVVAHGQLAQLITAGFAMSIATNLISVILIGIKAYQHQKFMKETIGLGNSGAVKILMFLTESGVVYSIFQIITISLSTADFIPLSTIDIAAFIWNGLMSMVSAIYPSLVILIVNNNYSIANLTDTSATGDDNPGTHISFARSLPLQETTASMGSQAEAVCQSGTEKQIEEFSAIAQPTQSLV
ncbi:hypothetical protein C8J56DRAFT_1051651 [Mycena floridula]|nr:hypothetical protein C8J56DRAFT_1051651 [Mycena floridula]